MPRQFSSKDIPNKQTPRFSMEAWVRYEPIVKSWLEVWPSPFRFKSDSLSPETVTQRLRDAVRSAVANNFPSFLGVDMKTLAEVWPQVMINYEVASNGQTEYIIRSKFARAAIDFQKSSSMSIAFHFDVLNMLDFQAVLYLANRGVFQRDHRPVTVTLTPELVEYVTSENYKRDFPNSVVSQHPDAKDHYIIL